MKEILGKVTVALLLNYILVKLLGMSRLMLNFD